MRALVVAVLAAGTYAFRLTGPLLRHRLNMPDRLQRLTSSAAAVLLVALVAVAALTQGHGFAGWARPTGVLVGGICAAKKMPLPLVVLVAAATTALLRVAGLH